MGVYNGLRPHRSSGSATSSRRLPIPRGSEPTASARSPGSATSPPRLPSRRDPGDDGLVSWSQVREITSETRRLAAHVCDQLDALIGEEAPHLVGAEPETLGHLVRAHIQRALPRRLEQQERRSVEHSFLWIQPNFEGGARLYGEANAVCAAPILEAVDAAAQRPQSPHIGEVSRGRQRLDALVAICESYLAGSNATARPRPRFLATIDLDAYAHGDASARLLWRLYDRPVTLTRVTTETLLCDSTLIPIMLRDGTPVAVGDAHHTFSDKTRNAIVARDGGCRTPGCTAPPQYCDVHHIVPGVGNKIEDGALHCRPCHTRIHRYGWKLKLLPRGILEYKINGRTYHSHPRAGPTNN